MRTDLTYAIDLYAMTIITLGFITVVFAYLTKVVEMVKTLGFKLTFFWAIGMMSIGIFLLMF